MAGWPDHFTGCWAWKPQLSESDEAFVQIPMAHSHWFQNLTHWWTNREDFVCKSCSKCKIGSDVDGLKFQPPIQWIVQNTKFPSLFYFASIVIHSQKRLIKHHWIPLVQRCVSSSCISCVLRGGHATYSPGRHIACASGFSSLVPRVFYRLCRGRLFSTLPTFVHRASLFGLSVVFIFGVSF